MNEHIEAAWEDFECSLGEDVVGATIGSYCRLLKATKWKSFKVSSNALIKYLGYELMLRIPERPQKQ